MHKLLAFIEEGTASQCGSRSRRRDEAFTLVELLVAIIVLGILAAVAFVVFTNQQAEALKTSVKSDVRNTVSNVVQSLIKDPTADPITAEPVSTGGNEITIEGAWDDYAIYGSNDNIQNWVYAYFSDKDGELSRAAEAGAPAYGQWRELTQREPVAGGGDGDGAGEEAAKDDFVTFAHKYFQCEAAGTVTITATSAEGPVVLKVEQWRTGAISWLYEEDGSATFDVEIQHVEDGGSFWAFSETAPAVSVTGGTCAVGPMFAGALNDGHEILKQDAWEWNTKFPDWASTE